MSRFSCAASFLSSVEWSNVVPEVYEAEGWSSGSKGLSSSEVPTRAIERANLEVEVELVEQKKKRRPYRR